MGVVPVRPQALATACEGYRGVRLQGGARDGD